MGRYGNESEPTNERSSVLSENDVIMSRQEQRDRKTKIYKVGLKKARARRFNIVHDEKRNQPRFISQSRKHDKVIDLYAGLS